MDKATILQYIDETDNLTFVSYLSTKELQSEIEHLTYVLCNTRVGNQDIAIKVFVPKRFPNELPKFLLEQYDILGFLPHIAPSGSVCYLEKESVYINIDNPKIVFQASFEEALKTIKDGLSKANYKDFREEFHVFWEGNKHKSPLFVVSFIDVGNEPKEIRILRNDKKAIIFDKDVDIERKKKAFFESKHPTAKTGIYIPLLEDCEIMPPKFDEAWDADYFVEWLKPKVSSENWSTLQTSILSKKPSRFEYIIFSIPRETGITILVGVQLKPKEKTKHPLLETDSGWGLKYLSISRLDTPSILPRGGADLSFQKKLVLIVGCGSVGSHIAINLAKAGIGIIGLVDDDLIKLENLQRFALGFQYSAQKKVEALNHYITKNYLNTSVISYDKKLEEHLELGDDAKLELFDLFISATGDPTINFVLNQKARELNKPLIVGWNEPLGIGGHALLSIPPEQGCYKCLYEDLHNKASFASKDQPKPFHLKHLGCGEVYTPYSAMDSIRTSELVTRLATGYLSGKYTIPQVISWKGESEEFTSQGFNLSDRYMKQTQDEMDKHKHNFINSDCSHCK